MKTNILITSENDKWYISLNQVETYIKPFGYLLYWLGYAVSVEDRMTHSTKYININNAIERCVESARGENAKDAHFGKAKELFLRQCKAYNYQSDSCTDNLRQVWLAVHANFYP